MMKEKTKKQIILVAALLLIVGAISFLESSKVKPVSEVGNQDINIEEIVGETESVEGVVEDDSVLTKATEARLAIKKKTYEPAKEISSPDGFINVDNITVSELIGKKIILIDFWTYSCINCQRTLPYLGNWHEKYADEGLVILGLHTPEFEFEKDYGNVSRAVEKWDVKYPVILDNDFSTWRSYNNRYWPRKYLIDIDGFIVYDHIGEGGYAETEAKIVELLNEKNEILGMKEVILVENAPENIDVVDFGKVRSPEMYFGSSRIKNLANVPGTECVGSPCVYETDGKVAFNTFELFGTWSIQPEEAKLTSDTGSIFVRFNANKVNLVAQSESGVRAEIYIDGEKVDDVAGYSVEDGVVEFKESDLYNLIDLEGEYGEHLLEIRFLEAGVEAFAFTFG